MNDRYDKPVGVSILTNGSRLPFLRACVSSLVSHTSYRPLLVGIFNNGSTDGTKEWLNTLLPSVAGIKWVVVHSDTDIGCAAGTNAAHDIVRVCEYALHLESDFEILPPEISGEDEHWLGDAVEMMEREGCDFLYLRRMTGEFEMAQHWWAQWMPRIDRQEGKYLRCPGFWWSNNPALRNVKALYEAGTLPLDASKDGAKGRPGWSKPELTAKPPVASWLHRWGLFVHELPNQRVSPGIGCKDWGLGFTKCKYGFFKDGREKFCQSCDRSKDFRDMVEHESRFRSGVTIESSKEEKKMGKQYTVVTVENGWGLTEFSQVMGNFPDARKIIMWKGALGKITLPGYEVLAYDPSLDALIKEADVALFMRVGVANRADYEKLLAAGVPVIVRESNADGKITHMEDGFIFRDDSWAIHWVGKLRDDQSWKTRVEAKRGRNKVPAAPVATLVPAASPVLAAAPVPAAANVLGSVSEKVPKVTVITPTYRRDTAVLRRCLFSMQLQTVTEWEQLVCSDGGEEMHAKGLVESLGDQRIRYGFTNSKKSGDFGNTVRLTMLNTARGEFVLFFDDDNVILPNYLERMIAALERDKEAGFAVCRVMHFGPLNEAAVGKPPKVLAGNPVKLYHVDPLQILVRRSVMLKVGWDTEVGYLSDGVTLEKLGNAAKCVYVDEVLGVHM